MDLEDLSENFPIIIFWELETTLRKELRMVDLMFGRLIEKLMKSLLISLKVFILLINLFTRLSSFGPDSRDRS